MLNAEVTDNRTAVDDLFARFGADAFALQATADHTPTLWVERGNLLEVLKLELLDSVEFCYRGVYFFYDCAAESGHLSGGCGGGRGFWLCRGHCL